MSEMGGSVAASVDDLDALLDIARRRLAREHDERSPAEVADDLVRFRHALDLLELSFARDAARFAASEEYQERGAISPFSWLSHAARMGSFATANALCVGEEAAHLPLSTAALREGRVGFAALALLARTERFVRETPDGAPPFDEALLLRKAETHTMSRFRDDCEHVRHAADQRAFLEEQLSAVATRRLELMSCGPGGLSLRGMLDPVAGATLRIALEPLAAPMGADDDRPRKRRLADALVEMASHCLDTDWPSAGIAHHPATDDLPAAADLPEAFRALGKSRADRALELRARQLSSGAPVSPGSAGTRPVRVRRPHLQVTAALETLLGLDGAPAGELDLSPPIAAATVQRIACDASVTRVLLGPDSTVVDVGRARRVPAPSTRTALRLRDKGCTWPGCDRPASWTEAHHLRHWARDRGVTELPNLVLVCTRHHWKVHEGGWQLVKAADGRLLTIPPGGRLDPPPCARGPGSDAA